jgi:hypothetical protein
MGKNAAGALALVLLWISLTSYFVAFHPGGIEINGHAAQNPRDVLLWLMQRLATGTPQSGGQPD